MSALKDWCDDFTGGFLENKYNSNINVDSSFIFREFYYILFKVKKNKKEKGLLLHGNQK